MMEKRQNLVRQLEDVIIEEATNLYNDSDIFNALVDILLTEYLKHIDINNIKPDINLAIAIILINTEDRTLFVSAFNALRCWEDISGPYWVVQEELIRHAGIFLIEEFICSCKVADILGCSITWLKLIDSLNLPNMSPPRLKQRLLLLSMEVEAIIALSLKNVLLFKETFRAYKDKHMFTMYLKWFNKWARQLLYDFKFNSIDNSSHIADTEINSNGAPVFLLASSSFKERKREALLVSFDGTLMNKPLQSTKIGNIGFSANKIEANKKRKLNLSFVPESIAKNNTLPCCAEVVGMIEELKSATATLEIQPQLIYFGAKKSINKQYSDEFIYDCDMYGAAEEICDQQGLENTSSTIVNISGLKHPNYKFKNVTDIVKIDDTQIKLGTGTRESTFIQNLGSEIWTAFSPFPSLPR